MTAVPQQDLGRADRNPPAAVAVLTDRLAAVLVQHEPGWRLPRLTALARRFNVSMAEIDAAMANLAARHLIRRLPNGQIYRASPAEYWIPLEGVSGLISHVDPMGGQLACSSRHAIRQPPAEEIGQSLGLAPGERALAIRSLWTVGGEPAALATSYLTGQFANKLGISLESLSTGEEAAIDGVEKEGLLPPETFPFPWAPARPGGPQPGGIQIEMGPPPASAARTLRLGVGESATMVTLSITDPGTATPGGLTITILRPELFRVVIEAVPSHISADGAGGLARAQPT